MTVMHVELPHRPPMVGMSTKVENKELWSRLQPNPAELCQQRLRTIAHQAHRKLEVGRTDVTGTATNVNPASNNKNRNILPKPDKMAARGKRKSRWKLKFHHQALPPEYLKHYKQQEKKRLKETKRYLIKNKIKKTVQVKQEEEEENRLKVEQIDKVSEVRKAGGEGIRLKTDEELYGDKSRQLLSKQLKIETRKKIDKPQAIPSSGRIRNYSDLPYMGEITLDGIKPRRGRKPKKADICHLIYKNYGQVFPGGPNNDSSEPSQQTKEERLVESPLPTVSNLLDHSQIQNRIINSLLEKRLTNKPDLEEEPLNLCIKDLNSLKIKLSRTHGNSYQTNPIKVECEDVREDRVLTSDEDDDDCLAPFNLVTTELGETSDEDGGEDVGYLNDNVTLTRINKPGVEDDPGVCWPGNSLLLDPMLQSQLLYYHKLSKEMAQHNEEPKLDKKITKKNVKRPVTSTANVAASPSVVKRKRSAIFIPPLPAENTTNPTTEVSICKFKFTGGAKPSLQEKKMLSVDSGGNFRYYSGTGDKNMRGYEYFPRESLQQCQDIASSTPAGVFLAASAMGSGEKIPEEIGHSGFFDTNIAVPTLTKEKKKNEVKFDNYQSLRECLTGKISPELSLLPDMNDSNQDGGSDEREDVDFNNIYDNVLREDGLKKSRKSRKSLAREKLEQTFKEKGFLIQTQQLESAEGATYCKFRQLRKFTRYLFRSWKDYLPGSVREMNVENDGMFTPKLETADSPVD